MAAFRIGIAQADDDPLVVVWNSATESVTVAITEALNNLNHPTALAPFTTSDVLSVQRITPVVPMKHDTPRRRR